MSTQKCRCYVDLFAQHSEVTGSNFIMIIRLTDGRTLRGIVDLGLFQEKAHEEDNNKLLFDPKEIDFALVTHAHVDHIGRLPLLTKGGYNGKIYCTEDTKKLIPYALLDAQKVLRCKAQRNNRGPLYEEADVNKTCQLLEEKRFNESFMVHENIRITFLSNGHLQGAAMILVQLVDETEEYINILFTGDYSNKNVFFKVLPIPKWVKDLPLTIVSEATYGATLSTSQSQVKCFETNIENAAKNGNSILIPAFSLGRVQEVLYSLKLMQQAGNLDKSIQIYLDGNLGIKYTKLFSCGFFSIKREMFNFLPENFQYVGGSREELIQSRAQKIIVTTSGMGTYGPAQTYIPAFLMREKSLIHFTGYCAEGTYGRKLKDAKYGEFVTSGDGGGTIALKKADVEFTTEFSAHAKCDELIGLMKMFKRLFSVIINHGEKQTKLQFAGKVFSELGCKKVGIINRLEGFRIGEYGLVKTLNTEICYK